MAEQSLWVWIPLAKMAPRSCHAQDIPPVGSQGVVYPEVNANTSNFEHFQRKCKYVFTQRIEERRILRLYTLSLSI